MTDKKDEPARVRQGPATSPAVPRNDRSAGHGGRQGQGRRIRSSGAAPRSQRRAAALPPGGREADTPSAFGDRLAAARSWSRREQGATPFSPRCRRHRRGSADADCRGAVGLASRDGQPGAGRSYRTSEQRLATLGANPTPAYDDIQRRRSIKTRADGHPAQGPGRSIARHRGLERHAVQASRPPSSPSKPAAAPPNTSTGSPNWKRPLPLFRRATSPAHRRPRSPTS